jgi:hypothetical protein
MRGVHGRMWRVAHGSPCANSILLYKDVTDGPCFSLTDSLSVTGFLGQVAATGRSGAAPHLLASAGSAEQYAVAWEEPLTPPTPLPHQGGGGEKQNVTIGWACPELMATGGAGRRGQNRDGPH